RMVYLTGEAFFDVKYKAQAPFLVETRDLSVKVLGTAFNVSAFANDEQQSVALKDGKVRVEIPGAKSIMLLPGEEVQYRQEKKKIAVRELNTKEVTSWQRRVIYFDNATLQGVINKLERYYGVNIDAGNLKTGQWSLTGEYKNATLKEVLES